ncbi:MAG: hypothetical protein EPO06_07720 [Burkholderiaceae bacterium]|nr:MAG: hypothetical protein EPO06_07720 [Burkholderiaceae bacterium]
MNIYAYIAVIALEGLVIGYVLGAVMRRLTGVAATFLFLLLSVGLGLVLAFPVLMGVAGLCSFLGITDKACINTDDRTVWLLAAPLVVFPAYAICMFIGRAVGRAREAQTRSALPQSLGIFLATVTLLPPFAMFVWLYLANTEQIGKALGARSARAARLTELCDTAVHIDVHQTRVAAKSVLFPMITNATYPMLEQLDFVELKRGYLKPGDAPYERLLKKPNEPLFVKGVANIVLQDIAEPEAEYEIAVKPIESKTDTDMGLYVEETTIRDRRTNEVLAVFTSAGERGTVMGGRFCPSGFDYVAYQREIPSYVLRLMDDKMSQRLAERIAAVVSRTHEVKK